MTIDLSAETLALSIQDLRSFAADVRQVAFVGGPPESNTLGRALHTLADRAEVTAGRLARGDGPEMFDHDDMMVIMMLAGYTTGAGGITQARVLIGILIDENENKEDAGERDGVS